MDMLKVSDQQVLHLGQVNMDFCCVLLIMVSIIDFKFGLTLLAPFTQERIIQYGTLG